MTAADRQRGLLDTSAVILLGRLSDPSALPDEALICAITLAELSVGPHVARSGAERAARQAHLQQAGASQAENPLPEPAMRSLRPRRSPTGCRYPRAMPPPSKEYRAWTFEPFRIPTRRELLSRLPSPIRRVEELIYVVASDKFVEIHAT